MLRPAHLLTRAWLVIVTAGVPLGVSAQDVAPQPAPIVRTIDFSGAKEIAEPAMRAALGYGAGAAIADGPAAVAERIGKYYRDAGFIFARVTTQLDQSTGALLVTIDEGVIEGVEFTGVDASLVRRFTEDFALRAGDVFNVRRARQALDVLLRPTRGAVRPGRAYARTLDGSGEVVRGRGTFDVIDRSGRRVLVVGLSEPPGRFRIIPDFGEREDWFSSVDGFAPSIGMGIAVFDHQHFNHAFVAGHLSYKNAAKRAGYALGFERPIFTTTRLFIGGEVHDLTASDDLWQVSSLEASLAALGARRSLRDYYRRRGLQINAAVRVRPNLETLVAWRSERQEPLATASDFSFWNRDQPYRANVAARNGGLNALIVGAAAASAGFERESLEASYRRHQLDSMFGEPLAGADFREDRRPLWRVDWTSELSQPGAFNSDFDFRRHILAGRARVLLTEHQTVGVRAVRGWSGGNLPPQRLFGVGGIGSVHGYEYKEVVGEAMTLLNVEYELGWREGARLIGFYDVGRVHSAATPASPWLKGVGFGVGAGPLRVDFGYKTSAIPRSLKVLVRLERMF